MPTTFPTVGAIAERLGEPLHRIEYIIKARKIQPIGTAGNARIFSESDVDRISRELKRSFLNQVQCDSIDIERGLDLAEGYQLNLDNGGDGRELERDTILAALNVYNAWLQGGMPVGGMNFEWTEKIKAIATRNDTRIGMDPDAITALCERLAGNGMLRTRFL